MDNDRALLRALRIERATSKFYLRKLRELMAESALSEFRMVCREAACERDASRQIAAKVTGSRIGDA